MHDYDDDYYFIQKADDERLPSLTANEDTVDRNYSFEVQMIGSPPFVFFNGAKEYNKKLGTASLKNPPDILFDGTNLVVRTRIRDSLVDMNLAGIFIHPAIYIDDKDNWHEDYWFLAFPERFDCWDREKSDFVQRPLELGGFKLHSVYTYSLNSALLDATPLEQRLLFKMGGTQDAFIVCHRSIARVFAEEADKGAKLVPISDF